MGEDSLSKRYACQLAYGLGFVDAREDDLARVPGDFVSITSRSIFRPWGADYHPWTQRIDGAMSPEKALADAGYVFDGLGEEAVGELDDRQPLVLYSPSPPTEHGWDRLMDLLSEGGVREAVTVAPAIEEMITRRFARQPLDLGLEIGAEEGLSGPLLHRGRLLGEYAVAGDLYGADAEFTPQFTIAGTPVVASTKIGPGILHVVLFDPSHSANRALTVAVYGALLRKAGVQPHWDSNDGVSARVYRSREMVVVGAQHPRARDFSSDFIQYRTDADVDFRVKVDRRHRYDWLALPSGSRGSVKPDREGFVGLRLPGTTHELFYLLPAHHDHARLDAIEARLVTFEQAMADVARRK